MSRSQSFLVSPDDLSYVISYLLVLCVSTRVYKAHKNTPNISRPQNKVDLFAIASAVELAILNDRDEQYIDKIDRLCVDVSILLRKVLSPSEMAQMRTSIRQKRYRSDGFTSHSYAMYCSYKVAKLE